jgi:hypothetical protein
MIGLISSMVGGLLAAALALLGGLTSEVGVLLGGLGGAAVGEDDIDDLNKGASAGVLTTHRSDPSNRHHFDDQGTVSRSRVTRSREMSARI